MRVGLACTGYSGHGGIQRANRLLANGLVRSGATLDVLALNDMEDVQDPSITVTSGRKSKIRWIGRLAAMLALGKYDLVICSHLHLAFVTGLLAKLLCPSSKTVLLLHGIEVWGRPITKFRSWSARFFGQILAVSSYTAAEFASRVALPKRLSLSVFPLAVDDDVSGASESAIGGNSAGCFNVLCVARLDQSERDKGVEHLLRAVAQLDLSLDCRLTLIGDGNYRAELEALASELGLKRRVRFLGSIGDESLWDNYRQATLFALPSAKEGFGLVYLEAMAFSLPVIAASARGAVDVVEHGKAGLLVPFADVDALRSAIDYLIRNPDARQEMGQYGRGLVSNEGIFGFRAFTARCGALLKGSGECEP